MIEPVVKEVVVPVAPEAAFARFTSELDRWWPRQTHSVFEGRSVSVTMESAVGGRLMERSESGEEAEWGRILRWDPPDAVAFSWYPGRDDGTAQEVEVTFTPQGSGTRVRLVHTGWETLGAEARETRDGYDQGWNPVLAGYAASLGGPVEVAP